ncbi:MAG TPA: GNAT family N-acetyltransferase [Blastocatellia bacterium]|nr:GNAT family N-acetyltransferase [Blastocatellia bacterium]
MTGEEAVIDAAADSDVSGIVAVLRANQDDRSLFQRSAANVGRHLRDFLVAKDAAGRIVGCAAVHRYSTTLAEVLSVAVLPKAQGQQVGRGLVDACLRRGEALGVTWLWLATLKPGYFARFGFEPMSRWGLPAWVLWAKLRQVFEQTPDHWFPSLMGRQTFMRRACGRAGTDQR